MEKWKCYEKNKCLSQYHKKVVKTHASSISTISHIGYMGHHPFL